MEINDALLGAGALLLLGLAGYSAVKTNELERKVNLSVREIESRTSVDVADHIIEQAVRDETQRQINKAVAATAARVRQDIQNEATLKIRQAVQDQLKTIGDKVSDKVVDEVKLIDVNEVKSKIVEKAADKVARKMDDKVSEVVEKYNDQLDSVGKIYSQIANGLGTRSTTDGRMHITFGN